MKVDLTKDEVALLRVVLRGANSLLMRRRWKENEELSHRIHQIESKLNAAECVGQIRRMTRRPK